MSVVSTYNPEFEARLSLAMERDLCVAPTGFPYQLFHVETRTGPRLVLATGRAQAVALCGKLGGKAKPVIMQEVVNKMGHKQTNLWLQQFGHRWSVKQNLIFFPYGPVAY